jgi:hypothetical protein
MPVKEDVEQFLNALHGKMKSFEIRYRPRDKNLKSLADLDIPGNERRKVIFSLTYEDCFSGPNEDTYMKPPMPDYYEFGKEIKGYTVYIKINLGRTNKPIDCMSFHIAERPITYPLKND